jgi:hypothetical protein
LASAGWWQFGIKLQALVKEYGQKYACALRRHFDGYTGAYVLEKASKRDFRADCRKKKAEMLLLICLDASDGPHHSLTSSPALSIRCLPLSSSSSLFSVAPLARALL